MVQHERPSHPHSRHLLNYDKAAVAAHQRTGTQLDSVQLFYLPEQDIAPRLVPLDELLNSTLSNGGNEYSGLHLVDGTLGNEDYPVGDGLALSSTMVVTDRHKGVTLGGSVASEYIGATRNHMADQSGFLVWMHYLYARDGDRVNPAIVRTDAPDLGRYEEDAMSNLIAAYYWGLLDIGKLSPEGNSFWRLVQKWAGPNADEVRRTAIEDPDKVNRLARDLFAINLSMSSYQEPISISRVQYGSNNIIHFHPLYTQSKGKNVIIKKIGEADPYSGITTWRQAQTAPVYYDSDRVPSVFLDPNKFRQVNRMLLDSPSKVNWMVHAIKAARTWIISDLPRHSLDTSSYLEHMPQVEGAPSQEAIANITANAVHAYHVNQTLLKHYLSEFRLHDRFHQNKIRRVRDYVRAGFEELYPGRISEEAQEFLERLIYGITEYMPIDLDEYIALSPAPPKRDKVEARYVLPVNDGSKREIPENALATLQEVTSLPHYEAVHDVFRSEIEHDINTLKQ